MPGLNFWISVDGVQGCDTQNGDATCSIAAGSTFLVKTYLDPLPTAIPQYDAYDIGLQHLGGVVPNQDANTDYWPDCTFDFHGYDIVSDTDPDGNIVGFGCAIGVAPAGPSSYVGLIGSISFTCVGSGAITMLHTDTDVIDTLVQPYREDSPNETLTINCVQGGVQPPPVTPHTAATTQPAGTPLEPTAAAKATSTAQSQSTATAKAVATAAKQTPGTSGENGGGGGLSGGVIAIIIVAGVAAAGIAGVVGWRVMQSRGGGGVPPA